MGTLTSDEMVRLSEANIVESYNLGFSSNGSIVLWKLRFRSGKVDLFWVASPVAVHFAKATRRFMRKYRWPKTKDWPDNAPEFTAEDWDFLNSKYPAVVVFETHAFSDAVITAVKIGPDTFQVIRLTPEHAVQIAELHWEQLQKGKLRDTADEAPPTTSRH
jgi:hypothetical protein